jgi:hypothetical protein
VEGVKIRHVLVATVQAAPIISVLPLVKMAAQEVREDLLLQKQEELLRVLLAHHRQEVAAARTLEPVLAVAEEVGPDALLVQAKMEVVAPSALLRWAAVVVVAPTAEVLLRAAMEQTPQAAQAATGRAAPGEEQRIRMPQRGPEAEAGAVLQVLVPEHRKEAMAQLIRGSTQRMDAVAVAVAVATLVQTARLKRPMEVMGLIMAAAEVEREERARLAAPALRELAAKVSSKFRTRQPLFQT